GRQARRLRGPVSTAQTARGSINPDFMSRMESFAPKILTSPAPALNVAARNESAFQHPSFRCASFSSRHLQSANPLDSLHSLGNPGVGACIWVHSVSCIDARQR